MALITQKSRLSKASSGPLAASFQQAQPLFHFENPLPVLEFTLPLLESKPQLNRTSYHS
jgi:hypothetical protein